MLNDIYKRLQLMSWRLKYGNILLQNRKFNNIHSGKRCFVIGNGPSLKNQRLSKLKNELTIVSNAFWKHPLISGEWQPSYYCFADPLYFDAGNEDFISVINFFKNLREKIILSKLFVPVSASDTVFRYNLLPREKTNFILFGGSLSRTDINEIDLTKTVPGVQNVSQMGIEAALFMGCNPIYLIGLDHDWLSHRSKDRHFYDDVTIKGNRSAVTNLSKSYYKEEIISCLNLWEGYEKLREIAKRKKVRIINATLGGFLDVFERQKLNFL